MNKIIASITYNKIIAVTCILLVLLSFYNLVTFHYLYAYIIFFICFLVLLISFFLFRRSLFLQTLFFFIPLSLSVDLIGDSQIQLPTEPLIGLCTLLFLGYIFKLKKEFSILIKNPIIILLLLELFWMMICTITSEMFAVSAKYFFIRCCYVTTFFFLGIFWMKDKKKPHLFYLIYSFGMILPIINGLLFHAKLDFVQSASYLMPNPFFYDHTVYGACIAFLLPALFIIWNKRFYLLPNMFIQPLFLCLLIFLLIAEYLSYSRAAWLSLACSLLLYILIKLKISAKFFIVAIVSISIFIFVNFDLLQKQFGNNEAISNKGDITQQVLSITNAKTDASNKERINRWRCAMRMGSEKPFFGYGPRTYKFMYGSFQEHGELSHISTFNGSKGHSHSDYLSYFAEGGYIAFIIHILLYLAIIYHALSMLSKKQTDTNRALLLMATLSLFTYFIHGIFNGFMEDEKMSSLVFMSMAIIVYVYEQEKTTTKESLLHS